MDEEQAAAAWTEPMVAPLAETTADRARRLSRVLYVALVERGMDEQEAELAAETLLDSLLEDEDVA
jgi:hypothetical protein